MGWLNGWPPLEASQNDMQAETVCVFEWCVSAAIDLAETDSSSRLLLDIGAAMVEDLLRERGVWINNDA